jgi:hypothetical protein
MADAHKLARDLTPNQWALLADLCDCPGLFAGQYVADGAGIEHLPKELWARSYRSGGAAFIDLADAHPTPLGIEVNQLAEEFA